MIRRLHEDERILEGIRKVARQHLGIEDPILPETRLVDGLGLDSLKSLTLVVEIENHFQVCLHENTGRPLTTVGDLMTVIRDQISHEKPDSH